MADVHDSGIELDRLAAWMDDQGLGDGPLTDVETLTGGTQNILLRFERAGRSYVLRHPPPHKRKNSDETMRREARVLGALAGTDVPHPALIAAEDSLDVLGAAFYLMEPVDGFNPSQGLPEPHASDPAMRHSMGLSMADGAASLARVDHVAVGLGDFGKPVGWLERQVGRWQSQLDGYSEMEGYPGPDIPGVDRVAEWLDANRPSTWTPGIIHGDLHFANVLMRHDRGLLAAIVDWELCTIGDPLLDLGHMLATWPADEQPRARAARRDEGATRAGDTADMPRSSSSGMSGGVGGGIRDLPSKDELIVRYASQCDRSVDDVDWFHVLACYRLGIILEGTHARAFAGKAPKEVGDMLHATTVGLFERALTVIA